MPRNRRQLLKGVAGLGVGGALAGCAGVSEQTNTATPTEASGGEETAAGTPTATQAPTGTATAWYQLPESEVATREETIATFNEQTRHTVEGADLSELQKKLKSAVPAGEGPQVFEWAHDLAGSYVEQGFLQPQSSVDVDLSRFTQAARQATTFQGNLVGLPVDAETVGLVYNRELVDSPPSTLSEMRSMMESFHDPDNGKYGLGYPQNPYFVSAWAQAFGGYYFDSTADPQLGLTLDETIRGFEVLQNDIMPFLPNDAGYQAQVTPFLDGNAPFAINGPWFLSSVSEKGLDVGVTGLPTVEGTNPRPYTGITLWYFADAMSADVGKANAARAFVEWYVTNEELLMEKASTQGSIPVLQSLSGNDDLPAKVKGFSQAVEQGYPMPADPKMNKVWGPVGDAVTKIFNGSADIESALSSAESTIRSNWE